MLSIRSGYDLSKQSRKYVSIFTKTMENFDHPVFDSPREQMITLCTLALNAAAAMFSLSQNRLDLQMKVHQFSMNVSNVITSGEMVDMTSIFFMVYRNHKNHAPALFFNCQNFSTTSIKMSYCIF